MRLFSEKVQPTFTNSDYNILTVEDFNEIFFDVYEFEISGKKFIAEKVAEYKGFPVVDIPLVLEGNKFNAPFILERGEFCVYYNPNNSTFVSVAEEDKGEPILELEEARDEVEEIIFERKEDILIEIQEARDSAAKFAESIRQQKLYQADTELVLKQERFSDELNITKAGLVEEFLGIIEGAKSEIYNFTETEQTKLAEYVVKHINKLSDTLVTEIEQKSLTAEQTFNTKLDELAANILTTAVVKEAVASRKHYDSVIKEKYQAISANVDKLVSEKIEALKADSQVELKAIEKTSFDAILNVNTNINKALSRVGTVKAQLNEALTTKAKELQDSITLAQDRISEYYDTKLQSIDSKIDNVTDEVRQQAIKLVEESKQSLLEAIDNIKVDVPNIIIEQKNGTSQEIDLKKVKKELEKTVTTKFTNEMMSLKRMIEMMSGGGSVAQQFAAGGTMNGDLNVTSRILSGGVDLATLFSGGGGGTGNYLPLSGGTITGSLTANSFVTLYGLSSQFVKGDGSLDATQYLTVDSLNSNVILYPTTAASDLSATYKLVASLTDPYYNLSAVNVSTGSITTNEKLVGTLASEAGIIVGHPGVINVTVLGNIRKTAGGSNASATFHFHIYKRSSSGTLTLIGISDNTLPSTNDTYAQFSTSLIANFGDWVDTDRLVVEFYAQRVAGGSNPTYDFQYGGDTPVRILLPLPISAIIDGKANLDGGNSFTGNQSFTFNYPDKFTVNGGGNIIETAGSGISLTSSGSSPITITSSNVGSMDGLAIGNSNPQSGKFTSLTITGESSYTGAGVTFNYDANAITQHRNALGLGTTQSPTFSSVSASNLVYRGGNTNASALTIGTNDNYDLNLETNGVTRMTILSSGNVGIGVANPTQGKLVINSPTVGTNRNLVFEQSNASSAQINEIVWRSSTGTIFDYAKIKSSYGNSFTSSYFTIQVASSAQVLQDRFHINTVGNVGIGTTTPNEELTVVGNISASGNVLVNGLSITGDSAYATSTTFTYTGNAAETHRNALGLGTTNSPSFIGIPKTYSLLADFTTTSTTFVDVSGLSFPIAANKNYVVTVAIVSNKNDTSGIQMRFTGPASPTKLISRATYTTSSNSTLVSEIITAFSTSTTNYNVFNGDGFYTTSFSIIQNGANAGIVQAQIRAITGGTAKLYAGSSFTVTQIN